MKLTPVALLAAVLVAPPACAETGYAAWLRYAPVQGAVDLPAAIVSFGDSAVIGSAREEVIRGVRGMTGRTLRIETSLPRESAILVGAIDDLRKAAPQLGINEPLAPDAFWLKTVNAGQIRYLVIAGGNDRGALYGAFALLRRIDTGEPVAGLDVRESPYAPVRWVNHWDNLDGSIERGYGGRSIFWENGRVREDLTRVRDYARLLASIGVNGCSINNVNADRRVITPEYLPQVARIADAMRPWGVRIAVSVDFASPQTLGKLDTFDPLDAHVIAWWKSTVDGLYTAVPDLGGIVLKADSEGRVGPSAYHRTHADAANVIARALAPHGGLLFYRGFVYDHHMDWRDLKNDRARAADDNFRALDGQFDDNAIVQIKHGPIDFQVREPASPLFGTLEKTNEVIELQITQEYFGQAHHLVYLVPMWKEALDFDLHAASGPTPVKALAAGRTFHRPTGGFVGVSNMGLDENWAGNHHSMANLYGFCRLAWNPEFSAKEIIAEWTRMTFGADPQVFETITAMQLASWRTYENYTGPLGLQTLTDIVGNHYGVAVEASERNGWGQWHRADEQGVGMDRTVATGTGYIGQYRPAVAKVYESPASCPDELLLFLHHVPYTYKLHSGKTVIQSIYDAHYDGAEAVAGWIRQWKALAGRVDEQRYLEVLHQLEYQAGQAIVWRDAVNDWFYKASGIADAAGRVGNHPGRYEAEKMTLSGYTVRDVTPWEGASGGKAIGCSAPTCTATLRYDGPAGWHSLTIQYFDQMDGASRFRLFVGPQLIDQWTASQSGVPARRMDSSASTRRVISGVALRPGDEIRVEGAPDRSELAGLDYFGARYYSGDQGRFTSQDPEIILRDIDNPQAWNKYAYTYNNPLRYTDPDGRAPQDSIATQTFERDARAVLAGQMSKEEFQARNAARATGAAAGTGIAFGPEMAAFARGLWYAVTGYFLTPNGQETAQNAIEAVAPTGASLRLVPTGDIDRAAVSLAEKIGGQASVRIESLGAREFDAVSKDFVGQTFSSANAALKPDSFLSKSRSEQIRATLDAAQQTGRKAYFEFTGGKPAQEVLDFIKRNAERVGAGYEVH